VERDKIKIMLGGSSAQTRIEKTVSVVRGQSQ
jgi:hypothetical protein